MAFASALMTSLPFWFRRFWTPSPDLYLQRNRQMYCKSEDRKALRKAIQLFWAQSFCLCDTAGTIMK